MRALFVVTVLCLGSTLSNPAHGDDGFFSGWNPFRMFRGQVSQTSTDQQLHDIRAQLKARGLSQNVIDQRVTDQQRTAAVDPPKKPKNLQDGTATTPRVEGKAGGGPVSIDNLRTKMLTRGIDVDTIDVRIARMARDRTASPPSLELRDISSGILTADSVGGYDSGAIGENRTTESGIRLIGFPRRNR